MAKLALCASTEGIPGMLVAGARSEEWVNPGHELFDTRSWRLDTLLTEFASWFAYWATDVHCRPKRLPATWRTRDRMTIPFDLEGEAWEVKAIVIGPEPAPLLKVSYEPVALGAAWHFRDPDSPLAPTRLEVTVGPRMEEPSRVEWNGEYLVVIKNHRGQAAEAENRGTPFYSRSKASLVSHCTDTGCTKQVVACTLNTVSSGAQRLNITLDGEHAEKLSRLADRTHVQEGTLARSLLSTAIDEADPAAANVATLLDGIPGAFESVQEGLRQAEAGETIPLDDL